MDIQWRPIGSSEFHHNASGFNKILFLFSSLIDRKIGFVKFINRFYYGSKYIDVKFTDKSIDELKKIHIYKNIDILKSCFLKEYQDSANSIYNEIINDSTKYLNLLKMSPITLIPKLINTYSIMGNDIKCFILCKNETEKNFVEDVLNLRNIPIIIDEIENIIPTDYARFVLDDIDLATKFNDPIAKSFLILNYKENFIYNEEKDIMLLKPDVIIKIGDVNNCQICNAYKDMN